MKKNCNGKIGILELKVKTRLDSLNGDFIEVLPTWTVKSRLLRKFNKITAKYAIIH